MSGSDVVDCGVGFFLYATNIEISKKSDRFVAHVDVKRLVSDNELGVESKHCLLTATAKEEMGDLVNGGEDRHRGDENGHLGWNYGLDLAPNLELDLGRNLGRN